MKKAWRGFTGTKWLDEANMRQFIQDNYESYDGDASFLEEPTAATNKLWGMLKELQKQERAKNGVLDMETEVVSSMTAYGPGVHRGRNGNEWIGMKLVTLQLINL